MSDWRKRKRTNLALLGVGVCLVVILTLLGNWQLRRLAWKNGLIHAVETRAFSAAVEAPGRREWRLVDFNDYAYLRVTITGHWFEDEEIAVKALTEEGPGYWIMSPLKQRYGEIIWINRGFVPTRLRYPESRPALTKQEVTITGLLRLPEPEGTLLQSNEPDKNRWYSRDVQVFSKHLNIPEPAPYFIDADKAENQTQWPAGGMTKIKFRNPHLQYALTWYAMALLLCAAIGYVVWLSKHGHAEE